MNILLATDMSATVPKEKNKWFKVRGGHTDENLFDEVPF